MSLSAKHGILVTGSQDKTVFFCSLSKLIPTEEDQALSFRKGTDKSSPLLSPIGFISMADEVSLQAGLLNKYIHIYTSIYIVSNPIGKPIELADHSWNANFAMYCRSVTYLHTLVKTSSS